MQPDNQIDNSGGNQPVEPVPTTMYAPEVPNTNNSEAESSSIKSVPTVADDNIHWAATEYIYQEKNGLWFAIFAIVAIGFVAADVLFLKSYTFSVLVFVMAIAIVVYSKRPPQQINYTLSPRHGLYIGENLHAFSEFKSFGVVNDGGYNFIKLIPVKRFGLGVSVYFPTEQGEKIVDLFGSVLPMDQIKLDTIDIITRKLRL